MTCFSRFQPAGVIKYTNSAGSKAKYLINTVINHVNLLGSALNNTYAEDEEAIEHIHIQNAANQHLD